MGYSDVDLQLKYERIQVQEMIAADPTSISFIRRTRTRSDTGGWQEGPPVTLPPQTFKVQQWKFRHGREVVEGEQGEAQTIPYFLLGTHIVDVQQGDEFYLGDDHFVVDSIDRNSKVRTLINTTFFDEAANV